MSHSDLQILLRESFRDGRFDQGERNTIEPSLAGCGADDRHFVRNEAFRIVREQASDGPHANDLRWLERVLRAVDGEWQRRVPVSFALFAPAGDLEMTVARHGVLGGDVFDENNWLTCNDRCGVPCSDGMPEKIANTALLLRALEFSARKHRDQRRKDQSASPYINHPIEVANVLAGVGSVTDLTTLLAAVLHDTVEDTKTTPADLEEQFGPEVRRLVEELTDDKSLQKAERKRLQVEHAADASPRAKLIKIADKICNVRDVTHAPPADWSLERRREYLDWTEKVVAGCRGVSRALEDHYDQALRQGRSVIGREA